MNKISINSRYVNIVLFVCMLIAFMSIGSNIWAQTNVTLYSVSPVSAPVGGTVVITGNNLLQCAPTHLNSCNVQFHDINLRRSTVSGREDSSTQVTAVVAAGLCPGTTTIKVGEVDNFSNAIPFTIADQVNVPAGCRVITSISPTSGTFGTIVTVNGRNLHSNVQLYDSSYGKTDVIGTMNAGATQVIFNMPNGLTPGNYSIRVGPSVSDVSNGLPFRFIGDITAPYISNIRINNITTSEATVIWDTNEPADGQVEICPSLTRCNINTPLLSSLTTSHIVNLSGLTANTRYYLWIKSKDGAGNLATGGPLTFRTLSMATPTPTPSPADNPVIISNFKITNITRYTATVTWSTDRLSDSHVLSCYFSLFCFNSMATSSSPTTVHSLNLTRLRANTDYSIQARSIDASGEQGYSGIVTFKTQPALAISNIQVTNITSSTATITWSTNYPADGGVTTCTFIYWCYVRTPTVTDPGPTINHAINVVGLSPNKKYYYQTVSKDSGGAVYGSVQSFMTLN